MAPEVDLGDDYEDFSVHGDKTDWSDDASMGPNTSPESTFCFVNEAKTDVFNQTCTQLFKKHGVVGHAVVS
eukprot:1334305-Alexandrium_andersonii.AAC.1